MFTNEARWKHTSATLLLLLCCTVRAENSAAQQAQKDATAAAAAAAANSDDDKTNEIGFFRDELDKYYQRQENPATSRRLGYYDPASVLARRLLADETMAKKAQLLRSFQQQHSSRGTKKNDYDEDAPPADYYYTVAGGGGDLPVEFRSVDEVLDDLAKQRLSKIAYSSSGQPRGGKKPLLGYGQLIGGGSSYDDLSFNALDSNSASSSNNEDEYQQKRAYAQGFHSVRGRRSGPSYYYANGNLLDQLDEFEKRALLSGFQSMRGKKDLVLEDLPLELGRYVAAKRRMLGFHGMRGKRSLAPNHLTAILALRRLYT
ncbi:hypothetical protein TKK_0018458 [Trichogramma kaykai]